MTDREKFAAKIYKWASLCLGVFLFVMAVIFGIQFIVVIAAKQGFWVVSYKLMLLAVTLVPSLWNLFMGIVFHKKLKSG